MHTHRVRIPAVILTLLVLTSCASRDHTTPQVEDTPTAPNSQNALEAATRNGLGMTVVEYRTRANTALAASAAATRFAATTTNVEILWIAADGTPTLGVSSQTAATKARQAHWRVQIVPSRTETDQRHQDARRWLETQSPRTRASIVLMWPDYTTGAINAARNTTVDPSTAPEYPASLHIRDVPGTIDSASTHSPIQPRMYGSPYPGDAFHTGKTPPTTCTLGVPTPTGFITVTHCTAPSAAGSTVRGQQLGLPAVGPNPDTRIIPTMLPSTARAASMEVPISGLGQPVIGAPLCKAGARSGWQCGTIVGLNGPDSFISTACALAGDSGGPGLIGNTAVGVTDISTIGNQNWCPNYRSSTLAYTVHRTVL